MIERLVPEGGPEIRNGVWFSRDGKRALLVAETLAGGFDIDGQTRAIESIRDALQATGVKNVRLLLSGSGVFASEARATIQSEARWLSAVATVLVILILLAAYRALGPVVLSALPVATGLVAGVATVSWIFGTVHGITLGFGATLIGEAVDYPSYAFIQAARGERLHGHALAHRTDVAAGCAHDSLRRIGDGALELPGLAQLGCLPSSEWARRGSRRAGCCPRSLSPAGLRARPMHCPSTRAGRWNSRGKDPGSSLRSS